MLEGDRKYLVSINRNMTQLIIWVFGFWFSLRPSMLIQYKHVILGIYMNLNDIHPCTVNASYTAELVVELATI